MSSSGLLLKNLNQDTILWTNIMGYILYKYNGVEWYGIWVAVEELTWVP